MARPRLLDVGDPYPLRSLFMVGAVLTKQVLRRTVPCKSLDLPQHAAGMRLTRPHQQPQARCRMWPHRSPKHVVTVSAAKRLPHVLRRSSGQASWASCELGRADRERVGWRLKSKLGGLPRRWKANDVPLSHRFSTENMPCCLGYFLFARKVAPELAVG